MVFPMETGEHYFSNETPSILLLGRVSFSGGYVFGEETRLLPDVRADEELHSFACMNVGAHDLRGAELINSTCAQGR